uniref:Uncharacterized protein n=1 Tax=Salix viminalis TaxID=40686 RepID=A0A6N2N7F1_SALVM
MALSTNFTEANQRGEMSEKIVEKTEEEVAGRGLLDLVFSWSIRDVRNRDLYKNKTKILLKQDQSLHELRSVPSTFLRKGL